jgi:hypothetical protein
MLKFNCFLLTVTLSFISLFINKTEDALALNTNHSTHNIKKDLSFNACAISTNNSFEELLNFDEQEKQPTINFFFSNTSFKEVFFYAQLQYLKICNLLNLNFTISKIIFPFHSFL